VEPQLVTTRLRLAGGLTSSDLVPDDTKEAESQISRQSSHSIVFSPASKSIPRALHCGSAVESAPSNCILDFVQVEARKTGGGLVSWNSEPKPSDQCQHYLARTQERETCCL